MFVTKQITIASAGTPVQASATSLPTRGTPVAIIPMSTNTGRGFVGNSSANALNSSGNGFELVVGQSVGFSVLDLTEIWLDSTVTGDKFCLLWEN